jgi:glycosyltransferase involved in cell wall biosynthesis
MRKESDMDQPEILYMVVPCYNEQEVLRETAEQLKNKYRALMDEKLISPDSRVVFVNDGSSDQTWGIIRELHEKEPALFSGIERCSCGTYDC